VEGDGANVSAAGACVAAAAPDPQGAACAAVLPPQAASAVSLSRGAPPLGDGLPPFLILPAASPLNAARAAVVAASAGACGALAALNGSAAQCGGAPFVAAGGVYFILARGDALGLVAAGPCGQ